ncbi:MAG: hypothetical protein ACSHW0_18830 [Thalassotalea sp.]
MKKFGVTFLIWVTLFIILHEFMRFRYILIESIYPIADVGPDTTRVWLLLISGSILHLVSGGALKVLIKSTSNSGLLGLALGISGVSLDLYTGSPLVSYMTSHPDNIDFLLMYGPLLSPFIFIPMGIYSVTVMQKYRQKSMVN